MDYSKGKIYKIWSPLGDKIYVGATTKQYLSQRMTAHRMSYNKWKNGKYNNVRSFVLFDEYGIENCIIELLEVKECTCKDELNKLEGHYIRTLKCVNKLIPDRTQKKYREDNKEHIKEYREANKEHLNEQSKKYYKDNKEHLKELRTQIITCECGSKHTHGSKTRHLKTKKHQNFIESKS